MDTAKDINNFDKFLEQAKKELEYLESALRKWDGLIEDANIYLILETFTSYNRASTILNHLEDIAASCERISEIKTGFEKVRTIFVDNFVENSVNLTKVLERLDSSFFLYLNDKLDEVVHLSEDAMLFEDDDSFSGEFPYDSANDFIEFLTGIYHLIEILKGISIQDEKVTSLKEHFKSLEDRFKKEFYHFGSLTGQLYYQRERSLPSEGKWWYKSTPADYKPRYIEIYRVPISIGERTANCFDFETLVNYAFDVMPSEHKQGVEQHIFECDHCFNEVFQLRSAEQAIPEKPVFKPMPVDQVISTFIRVVGSQVQIGLKWIEEKVATGFLKPALVYAPRRLAEPGIKPETIERPYFELQLEYEKPMTILPSEEDFRKETLIQGQRGEFRNLLRTIDGGEFWYFILGEIESKIEVIKGVTPEEYLPINVENIPSEADYLYLFLSQSDEKLRSLFKSIEEIIKVPGEAKEKALDMENIILIKITRR